MASDSAAAEVIAPPTEKLPTPEPSTPYTPPTASVHQVPIPRKGKGKAVSVTDKRRWTTEAQLHWLIGRIPSYLEAQAKQRYDKYWVELFRDWFQQFPPRKPTESDPEYSDVGDSDDDDGDNEDAAPNADEANSEEKQKPASKQKKKQRKKKKVSLTSLCQLFLRLTIS